MSMTAETVAPALSRDEIEAKLIDLADTCSRVPLRFVMASFAWSDAGAEDVPQGCARAAHRGMPS
jgi:hypothetical protein